MRSGLDASPEVAPTAAAPPSWLGPAGYAWSRLAPLALGRYAEYLVKMAFTVYGLDVYGSEVDDKGIDFVIRAGPSRYFDVQVKSLRGWGGYAFMKKATFLTDPSRLVALVHCLDGEPPVLYLIQGSAWLTSTRLLVARDYGEGRKSAPEYGISLARRNAKELDRYRFETVVDAL